MPQCVKCERGLSHLCFWPAGLAGFLQKKNFVLMMVDPDAPGRANPPRAHRRHRPAADIKVIGIHRPSSKGLTWGLPWPPCSS
ncbi:uncharacterized protein LOC130125563 [Lampris incognitus]|uniref:uncharacterized protein LOC130125563 n=1 Tax=Lampris incognitus TaxID=2546036 RepID=UPI0024B57F56|nr:uncharacterized protein LOC130125563 [Lampris incognitus]